MYMYTYMYVANIFYITSYNNYKHSLTLLLYHPCLSSIFEVVYIKRKRKFADFFFYCLFIYGLQLEIQLSRGEWLESHLPVEPCHIFLPVSSQGQDFQREWVVVVQRQFRNFSAISWLEQVNFQWDDNEVRFVLNQHAVSNVIWHSVSWD